MGKDSVHTTMGVWPVFPPVKYYQFDKDQEVQFDIYLYNLLLCFTALVNDNL